MEVQWKQSHAVEKKIMQSLIQAAGMYVHLEYGRKDGAEKIARKAVSGLQAHQNAARRRFNVDLLIAHLKRFDPIPPKLVAAEAPVPG
jgi:predicted metal-dependent hydrolase